MASPNEPEAAAPATKAAEAVAVEEKEKKPEKLGHTEARRGSLESWQPKTELGRKVRNKEVTAIDEILDSGQRIMESEIVDILLPDLSSDLLMIGQAKGKFGGGQRRVFKQTQKKTAEGNKPSFATMVIVGNRNGYIGLGYGKSRETVQSREKALRNAKLNIMKIRRGCGSWQCGCKTPHTIPFKVKGKCGSVVIELMPAPKGAGLRVAEECRKILALAGVKDIWSKTFGQTRTTINLASACCGALKKLGERKLRQESIESLGLTEGMTAVTEK